MHISVQKATFGNPNVGYLYPLYLLKLGCEKITRCGEH